VQTLLILLFDNIKQNPEADAVGLRNDLQRIESAMEALARVGQSHTAAAVRAERAGVPMTGAAQQVLRRVIEFGPVRVSDLARHVHMSDASVSRLVTALEESGQVTRTASADDGRVAMVRPTAAGRRTGARLRRAADEIFQERLEDWTARDLARLAGLMERLAADLRRPATGRARRSTA
jgi:DNA-binding MarR family transcriptional regulator